MSRYCQHGVHRSDCGSPECLTTGNELRIPLPRLYSEDYGDLHCVWIEGRNDYLFGFTKEEEKTVKDMVGAINKHSARDCTPMNSPRGLDHMVDAPASGRLVIHWVPSRLSRWKTTRNAVCLGRLWLQWQGSNYTP